MQASDSGRPAATQGASRVCARRSMAPRAASPGTVARPGSAARRVNAWHSRCRAATPALPAANNDDVATSQPCSAALQGSGNVSSAVSAVRLWGRPAVTQRRTAAVVQCSSCSSAASSPPSCGRGESARQMCGTGHNSVCNCWCMRSCQGGVIGEASGCVATVQVVRCTAASSAAAPVALQGVTQHMDGLA